MCDRPKLTRFLNAKLHTATNAWLFPHCSLSFSHTQKIMLSHCTACSRGVTQTLLTGPQRHSSFSHSCRQSSLVTSSKTYGWMHKAELTQSQHTHNTHIHTHTAQRLQCEAVTAVLQPLMMQQYPHTLRSADTMR